MYEETRLGTVGSLEFLGLLYMKLNGQLRVGNEEIRQTGDFKLQAGIKIPVVSHACSFLQVIGKWIMYVSFERIYQFICTCG